jgi:Flp pilus assembly protein TadD
VPTKNLGFALTLCMLFAIAVCPTEAKPTFDERLAEAERFRIANDFPNALRSYASLVKVRPADSRVHANYGFVLVQTGNFPAGKEEIDKALILNHDDPTAHQALAVYYMITGDKKNARLEYIKTISLDPRRNCHCGGIQAYLGITPSDEKKALKEAVKKGRAPKPFQVW